MATEREVIQRLVQPILDWLERGGDAWEMDIRYWEVRRELLEERSMVGTVPERILSDLDGTMDVFRPGPDRGELGIDEAQMRAEVTDSLARLRALGYLD